MKGSEGFPGKSFPYGEGSQAMNPRVTLFGEPLSRSPSGTFLDQLMTFSLPGAGAGYKPTHPLAKEFIKIGYVKDIPGADMKLPRELKEYKGEEGEFLRARQKKRKITNEEKLLIQALRGKTLELIGTIVMEDPGYQEADLRERHKVMRHHTSKLDGKLMKMVKEEIEKAHDEGRELTAEDLQDVWDEAKGGLGLKEELQRIQEESGIDIFSGRQ
jgi:hypothetical protein